MRRAWSARTAQCRQRVLATTAIASVTWLLAIPAAPASASEPVRSGDVVVVEAADGTHELTHGGSATQFSLRLPQGATCPGDSANDQWRVQSFMVPATDPPGSLHYGVQGPDGPGQYAVFLVNTSPLVDSLTDQNTRPGKPGVIPAVPPLSFAVFPPGLLPSGRYRIGIACTLSRVTAQYWDTEIVLTSSPGDKPGQFVWRLSSVPASVNDPGEDFSNTWLLVLGGGGLTLALLFWKRNALKSAINGHRSNTTNIRKARNAGAHAKEPQ